MEDLKEAIAYYRRQGAPSDQTALVSLLREVQEAGGGTIPASSLEPIAQGLGVKQTYLQAVIRRIPSLRLGSGHVLELCAGPNCGKHAALARMAESMKSSTLEVRFVPCMRMCGKGPNLRFDGTLYHKADESLLKKLVEGAK